MRREPLTLGQFRKITENLSDDIKLNFSCHVTGLVPICTMDAYNENQLVFVHKSYMEEDIHGILRAMTYLKKK